MPSASGGPYAGDVSPSHAYEALKAGAPAVLIDVRSRPEWTFVGLPDLSGAQNEPALIEWQVYPGMAINADFVDAVAAEVESRGGDHTTQLYFLCRSGVRSKAAAIAMTEAGFSRCYNIDGGFEGPIDGNGHRGQASGWKAAGLPWKQS